MTIPVPNPASWWKALGGPPRPDSGFQAFLSRMFSQQAAPSSTPAWQMINSPAWNEPTGMQYQMSQWPEVPSQRYPFELMPPGIAAPAYAPPWNTGYASPSWYVNPRYYPWNYHNYP